MKSNRWVSRAAGAGALTLILAMPAAAQTRGDWQRNDNRSTATANRSYRENERVTLSGRVSSFSHESNGYRVRLDRGQSFFVPESYYRSHRSNFRLGVSINLAGIFRGGDVYVDAGNYPAYGAYDNGYVRGVIDRVDYRTGIAWLRDDANGRLIEADLRDAGRYSRIDGRDLRRGDYVELSGQWLRGNIFAVRQIDSVRTGRY